MFGGEPYTLLGIDQLGKVSQLGKAVYEGKGWPAAADYDVVAINPATKAVLVLNSKTKDAARYVVNLKADWRLRFMESDPKKNEKSDKKEDSADEEKKKD
ncbi:hypothetical protein PAEPH01_2131 [Pancytospora epiphaga]|nr:hypothetical protein PAEPH01_2131 [Pancytospora epiphaga]